MVYQIIEIVILTKVSYGCDLFEPDHTNNFVFVHFK